KALSAFTHSRFSKSITKYATVFAELFWFFTKLTMQPMSSNLKACDSLSYNSAATRFSEIAMRQYEHMSSAAIATGSIFLVWQFTSASREKIRAAANTPGGTKYLWLFDNENARKLWRSDVCCLID